MLDFYLIDDQEKDPEYPEQTGLQPAGELDDTTFERLQTKGIIPLTYDYYADFRWRAAQIKEIQTTIAYKQLQADSDVQNLLTLLDKALEEQTGLIAYSD